MDDKVWLTEVATWTPTDEDFIEVSMSIAEDPCGEGFHQHKNGMIHVSIELTDEEQELYRSYFER